MYFKERIAKADGKTLSQIAESISDLLDTGVYVDKSGLAVVNPFDEKDFKVNEVSRGLKGGNAGKDSDVRFSVLSAEEVKEAIEDFKDRFRGKDKPEIDVIERLEDVYDYALSLGETHERAREFANNP